VTEYLAVLSSLTALVIADEAEGMVQFSFLAPAQEVNKALGM
jgi:hypothetical protein